MTGGWKIALWVLVVALVFGFMYLVRGVLLPFIVGGLVAILLDPLIRNLRKRGLNRGVAIGLVFSAFFGIVIAVGAITLPLLGRQVVEFSNSLLGVTRRITAETYANNYFLRWNPKHRVTVSSEVAPLDKSLAQFRPTLERFGLPSTQSEIVEEYVRPRRRQILSVVQGFFSSLLGVLGGFGAKVLLLLFAPLVALFLLLDLDRLKATAPKWIPPTIRPQTVRVVQDVGEVFQSYLRGITISWMMYATVTGISLSILEAPYSVLLAIIFATFYLVPIFGDLLNNTILFIIIVLSGTSSNWFFHMPSPWMFALVLMGVQFSITLMWDQLIHPKLVGSAVGLRPAAAVFAVATGGALFGFVGMLIAFPVGGAIKVILERVMRVTTKTGSDSLGIPAVPLRHRAPMDG